MPFRAGRQRDLRPPSDRRRAASEDVPDRRFPAIRQRHARILGHLIGGGNVAGPTLGSMVRPFGLAPLIGKQLAIICDARFGGNIDQHVVVERLLAITGEDALTVDRKLSGPLDWPSPGAVPDPLINAHQRVTAASDNCSPGASAMRRTERKVHWAALDRGEAGWPHYPETSRMGRSPPAGRNGA